MLHKLKQTAPIWLKLLTGLFAALVSCLILTIAGTVLAVGAAQKFDVKATGQYAGWAQITLAPLRWVTVNRCPLVKAWDNILSMGELIPVLEKEIYASLLALDGTALPTELKQQRLDFDQDSKKLEQKVLSSGLITQIERLAHLSTQTSHYVNQSRLLNFLVPDQQQQKLLELVELTQAAHYFLDHFAAGEHQVVVLLHNNDEIRAGGGFMGSAAHFSLTNGQMSRPIFYDIYDLAGQVDELDPAPAGVEQYLSAGTQKLALTDANWQADFSRSAQDILKLLQQTDLPDTDLLIAVNLDLIRDILSVIGPVSLPDSAVNQTVTANNLSRLARQNRYDFFAGDKQKKVFLQQLYTALKLELVQLEQAQLLHLAAEISTAAQAKKFFFYSVQPSVQALLVDHNLAGVINPAADHFLYLVESNVGINKANQNIERVVELTINAETIFLKIIFENLNHPLSAEEIKIIHNNPDFLQADHLGYVNYLRLLTDVEIKKITANCNGQTKELQEKQLVPTWQGQAYQLGFLLTVPEQTAAECEIIISPAATIEPDSEWAIIKQPGLPPTRYNINHFDNLFETVLNQDLKF